MENTPIFLLNLNTKKVLECIQTLKSSNIYNIKVNYKKILFLINNNKDRPNNMNNMSKKRFKVNNFQCKIVNKVNINLIKNIQIIIIIKQ